MCFCMHNNVDIYLKKKKDTPITVVPNIENKSTQCLNSISFSQSSNYIMECGVLRL